MKQVLYIVRTLDLGGYFIATAGDLWKYANHSLYEVERIEKTVPLKVDIVLTEKTNDHDHENHSR